MRALRGCTRRASARVLRRKHGQGLRVLTGTVTSPTLAAQLDALREQYPEAQWIQWEPISRDAVRAGARIAYGKPVDVIAQLDQVDVLLAIESDLLSTAPGHLRYTRDFASRRNPSRGATMSRVYAIESTPTLVGVGGRSSLYCRTPRNCASWVGAIASGILRECTDLLDARLGERDRCRLEGRARSGVRASGGGAAVRKSMPGRMR